MTTMVKNWHELWDGGKYKTAEDDLSLRALLDLDALYSVTEGAWQEYVRDVINKLGNTNRKAVLLEIGCGAGAFLRVTESWYDNQWGVDFSARQIEVCRQALPVGNFTVCEACDINLETGFFDIVISTGVFSYFPNLDYTRIVLNKMLELLKEEGAGAVLDVTDIKSKDAYLSAKLNAVGEEAFSQLPPQTYYSKEVFVEFTETNGLTYRIEPQTIANYSNTPFRFNFFFWKGK